MPNLCSLSYLLIRFPLNTFLGAELSILYGNEMASLTSSESLWLCGWDGPAPCGRGRLSSAYTGCTMVLLWAHLKCKTHCDERQQLSSHNHVLSPFLFHLKYSVQQQDLDVWRTRLTRHKCPLQMLCLHFHSIKYDCILPHTLLKQLLLWQANQWSYSGYIHRSTEIKNGEAALWNPICQQW